jgi:hypothetical protein
LKNNLYNQQQIISRIYRELLQINTEKKKARENDQKQSTKEETQMTNKREKMFTFMSTVEMQVKA